MSGSDPALGYVEGRGYYDRAGRRLFLSDGSPDPDTPSAYRYRFDPDSCDPTAPESDPANPRYEPPHLRHRPGDTWEIGGKPADPDDPGPYGSRGWYQDTRTGRHRRNELPDPPEPEVSTQESGSEYRFDRLREDAWDDFMTDSAPLAAAHRRTGTTAFEREIGGQWALWVRLIQWLIAVFKSLNADPAAAVPDSTPPRTAPPRRMTPTKRDRGAGMARAVAGAQRARAGVASWA
ncbi:hypothetical protein [Glycomyces salinus]|uniref:hypothetical protein n=1 Tax=Glycomyces salinus TaxID=980294 RepID=UPI0018EDC15F|nr:hypothetical protein [Glycomyces salinus]